MANKRFAVLLILYYNITLVILSRLPQNQVNRLRHPLLFDWTASCGACNPERCEEIPSNCSAGIVRDACDCCDVCGNLEGTSCDLPNSRFRFGQCGKGLVCIATSPGVPANLELTPDGYCTCESSIVICGNDGRTYVNSCRFERALARNPRLSLRHKGPCNSAPLVDIPPMNQTAESGSAAVFSCTVSGFPFAWFEWFKDGANVLQLDLTHDVTVQIRSGPLKYQVTSWLEIKRSRLSHSGFYTCVAKNRLGEANATALLEVINDDMDSANFYVFRGNHYQFANNERIHNPGNLRKNLFPARGFQSTGIEAIEDTFDQSPANNENSINQYQENSKNHENIASSDDVGDVLVETLEELVEPKQFRDIFFDDFDISEGSTVDEDELQIHK